MLLSTAGFLSATREKNHTLFAPTKGAAAPLPSCRNCRELAKETFELGVYTRFFEVEVLRDERRFGGLAHVGASVASAKLHLDPAFAVLQDELHERMRAARTAIARHRLPIATGDWTPICMVQFDAAERARRTVKELMERGYYCCYSSFPAVPMDRPSLRFTMSRHNDVAEVERFVEVLAEVVPRRLEPTARARGQLANV
jgi:hypothetical protein